MTEPAPFRLGVNYWPGSSAMGFWRALSEAELEQDFARIRGAGLDCVRLFLTWEDFQPSPDVIDKKMLALLINTMDSAASCGLVVMPTLFTGHMSGANWFPAWAVRRADGPQRFPIVSGGQVVSAQPLNWYADEAVRSAQIKLAKACAQAIAGHPALLAWDLGNENSNCVLPPNKDSARTWLFSMSDALRKEDPGVLVTLGLHMEDLEEDRRLGPKEAAEACDFLTMHGYPGYASFTRSPTDERLLPFLSQLTRFLGGGKQVLFSEFGVPTLPEPNSPKFDSFSRREGGPELVTEVEAADYARRGLLALAECGASGAMLWCHSDYSPALYGEPPFAEAPHERTFGMVHSDGTEKPVIGEVRSFSRRKTQITGTPRVSEASFIDLTCEDYYDAPSRHLARLYHKYCSVLGEPLLPQGDAGQSTQ